MTGSSRTNLMKCSSPDFRYFLRFSMIPRDSRLAATAQLRLSRRGATILAPGGTVATLAGGRCKVRFHVVLRRAAPARGRRGALQELLRRAAGDPGGGDRRHDDRAAAHVP